MERKDTIQNAYRLTGSNNFYDGMITCSTASGKAVCRAVWGINKTECDEYLTHALAGIPTDFSGQLLEVPVALTAASFFPDITLTIGMTPSDFVWQGFMQGKRDGCKEWPVENESLFTYHGQPLPYMPFVYQHPQYWQCITAEAKRTGDMINSRKLFDDSEAAHPITEAEFIKVENIQGKLLLIGAQDDVLWDTARYIRRMENRLEERPHTCEVEAIVYPYATHFVFPEGLMKVMLSVGSDLLVKLAFQSAKKHPKECKAARMDIDRRITASILHWKQK